MALLLEAAAAAAVLVAAGSCLAKQHGRRRPGRRFMDPGAIVSPSSGMAKSALDRTPACRSSWLREPRGVASSAVPAVNGNGEAVPPAPLQRLRVVLVATGSVASVKVPELSTALCKEVALELVVVLTGPAETMAGRVAGRYCSKELLQEWEQLQRAGRVRVLCDADEWEGYEDVSTDAVVHVELRKWADAAVVAPCSANSLAKVALGLCDNLAMSLLRCWDPEKPIIVAPAMNTMMWEHPTTAAHLRTLESWGYRIIPTASKRLACGDEGRGALAPVAEIVAGLQAELQSAKTDGRLAACGDGRNGQGAWRRRGFDEWVPREACGPPTASAGL